MTIDREALEARRADLGAQKQGLIDQVNAVGGAIQDCEFWLRHLVAEENLPLLAGLPAKVGYQSEGDTDGR